MNIDLREIPVLWINLKEHEKNKEHTTNLLNRLGFKNHQRTPGIRVSGYDSANYGQSIDHYMGVGLAQLNAMRSIKDQLPALILEDDVDVTEFYNPIIRIPDGTDAVYLGVSKAGKAYGYNLKNGYARIFNVLAAHAILYISKPMIEEVIEMAKKSLINDQMPFDIPLSQIQQKYQIITPVDPFFYQSDKKESQNKWESLTTGRIKIYG